MKVGLYFGSFNPIHVGHLVIANYLATQEELNEVWFVVSPHNPHKKKNSLLEDYHRLAIVNEAVDDNSKLKASNIEFDLEQPSYTAITLAHLREKYPEKEFALIMGEDNLRSFHKWYNHEQILENHQIFVYPRVQTEQEKQQKITTKNDYMRHKNVRFCENAPIMAISSSYIRRCIKEGKDVKYLLTPSVHEYVDEMNFYR